MTDKQQQEKQAHIQKLVKQLNQDNHQLDVILELSSSLVEVGDLEQAEDLLTRSLSIYPQNQDLRYNLGNVYYLAESFDKANNIFDELINDDYGFEAYLMKAKTLDQMGQTSLAIAFALTAFEKAPNDVATIELLADLLMASGSFETAIDYYQRAQAIEPKAKFAFNIALCLMSEEKPYQQYLDQAKQLDEKYFLEHEQKLAQLQKFLTENGGSND